MFFFLHLLHLPLIIAYTPVTSTYTRMSCIVPFNFVYFFFFWSFYDLHLLGILRSLEALLFVPFLFFFPVVCRMRKRDKAILTRIHIPKNWNESRNALKRGNSSLCWKKKLKKNKIKYIKLSESRANEFFAVRKRKKCFKRKSNIQTRKDPS